MTAHVSIPGFTRDDPSSPRSPVGADDLDTLAASVMFGPDDRAALRAAGEIVADQVEVQGRYSADRVVGSALRRPHW